MSSCHDKCRYSGSSKRRCGSVSLLVLVCLSVPFPPYFSWREHSSTSAHVSEGTLFVYISVSCVFIDLRQLFIELFTCPALCVPPPDTRGIRATALPVPHDSAECWCPAFSATAYACLWFLAMFVCTASTMSGRIGTVNTAGRGRDDDGVVEEVGSKTETVGRDD